MAALLPFRDINLHASDSFYAFTSPSNPTAPTLVVERPSGDVRLSDGKPVGAKRVSSIAGILGIIKLRLDKYLVIIPKSQQVGRLRGSTVYKVASTELLPLHDQALHDNDEDVYLKLLKSTLNSAPMYFSYSLDLTNSFQRQAQSDPSAPLWKRTDDRFFWNKFIATDFLDFRSGHISTTGLRIPGGEQSAMDPYILPVISGMLNISKTMVKGRPVTFVILSRRSRHRTGTRYFSRGIDESGNVANFCETEEMIILNDQDSSSSGAFSPITASMDEKARGVGREIHVLSYIQTRGSVPAFWTEINTLHYTPKLQVRSVDSAVLPAKRHFEEQIRVYGDNYLVNLVNQKGRENRVKEAYEGIVRQLQSSTSETAVSKEHTPEAVRILEPKSAKSQFDRLHYVYFDFHNETKGLKWHRAQILLDQLYDALTKQRYFHGVYTPTDRSGRVEVRSTQMSVVRTNCMDCLDRTNVVQTMLGRFMLNAMLHESGVLGRGETAQEDVKFEHLFRNAWADNADVISRSYSGTGALKTDFTRTGERTKAGMLNDLNNSITRYVKNNFLDGPRQDGFDILSGAYLPSTSNLGGSYLFVDRRPPLIQAVPYILAASLFFISIASATRRPPESSLWPLRFLTLLFVAIAAYCANFMWSNGMLYVNWPKLNTPPWASDGVSETMTRVRKDPLVGQILHERSRSSGRLAYMEEGKKRIE